MQKINGLFSFYIFSSIHVALGVFCLVKITLLSYNINENRTALFCFFATIVSYNFIRFLNVATEKNWLAKWYTKQKPILTVLTFLSAVIVMYLSFGFRLKALLILLPFSILTFFYGMKLPRRLISLRKVPGLKIFLIAFCFSGVTVLFPLVQNGFEIGMTEWWLFMQRLIFIILITLPFDIRDVDFDSSQLKTIPQRFGVLNTKIIGVLLVVGIIVMEYFLLENKNILFYSVLIICFLSLLFLVFSKRKQTKYYSAFWVESLPIIWYLLLLGLNL